MQSIMVLILDVGVAVLLLLLLLLLQLLLLLLPPLHKPKYFFILTPSADTCRIVYSTGHIAVSSLVTPMLILPALHPKNALGI
jgi:hypothetical protein